MIKKSVIVTALFDIGRDKWNNYNQSYNTYLFWMDNILNVDSDFIIYTEQKFLDRIVESRKKIDKDLSRTKIIIQNFEDLNSYKKFHQKIVNLMSSEEFKKKIHFQVPEMLYAEYNTIIFNKFYFIKNAIEESDYDFYVWCDAGLLRDNSNQGKVFPKIEKLEEHYLNKITFFSHDTNFQITNREIHLLSQYRYIHGGCFFVPKKSNLNFLINYFETLLEKYFDFGYVGSEEKYFDFCYEDNKDEFNIVKSDWRQYFELFG